MTRYCLSLIGSTPCVLRDAPACPDSLFECAHLAAFLTGMGLRRASRPDKPPTKARRAVAISRRPAWSPMVPEPDAEPAGGMDPAHERGGERCRGRRPAREHAAAGQAVLCHVSSCEIARCSCRQTSGSPGRRMTRRIFASFRRTHNARLRAVVRRGGSLREQTGGSRSTGCRRAPRRFQSAAR